MKNSLGFLLLISTLLTACVIKENPDNADYSKYADGKSFKEMLLVSLLNRPASVSTNNTDTKNCTVIPEKGKLKFSGKVYDGGYGSLKTYGSVLSFVEIETSPVIANINITDEYGSFSIDAGICQNVEYTFTAKKYGYKPRSIKATAREGEDVSVSFVLERDSQTFYFPSIRLRDLETGSFITGSEHNAMIGYSVAGVNLTFSTNNFGQASPVIPRDEPVISVGISANGYKDCSFTADVSNGIYSSVKNCQVSVTGSSLSIDMQK